MGGPEPEAQSTAEWMEAMSTHKSNPKMPTVPLLLGSLLTPLMESPGLLTAFGLYPKACSSNNHNNYLPKQNNK